MLTTLGSSTLLAERFGSDPPELLALHGWGRNGGDFVPILEGRRGLALHLPGFGPASAPETVWSSQDYADAIASAIQDSEPLIVVGHSFGGRVAIRLAASYPNLVKSLVLTGVPIYPSRKPSGPKLSFRFVRFLHSMKLIPDSLMEAARQRYGSQDYKSASGVMREILVGVISENYLADAARVGCQVAMVWGELDIPAPVEVAQKALDYFPNATLKIVAGAGHLMTGSLVKELSRVIDRLLDVQ